MHAAIHRLHNGGTTVGRIYVHGARVDEIVLDTPAYTTTPWSYHHYDAQGNCILLTDSSGNLTEQYSYDAFGKPYFYNANGNAILTQNLSGNRFLFQGREWLTDVQLYDFRNRLYHPELGRFIQPDPKEFSAGDYNLYRYCHNDPVNKSDPFGLDDAVKFFKAIADFIRNSRPDAGGVNPKDVGRAVVADAKEAAKKEGENLRPGHGVNTGKERAYAEYAKNGSLVRSGPSVGTNYNEGPQAELPGPPAGVPANARPLTGSHSHGPGSGPSFERKDIPSANRGSYISSVGSTGDGGARISIYIPGGGGYYHAVDGEFFTGK